MYQNNVKSRKPQLSKSLCATALAFSMLAYVPAGYSNQDQDRENESDALKTASPIKHVIIIVGENRSFDHLFATYVPKDKNERVLNLLSEGIINADGTPGPNFAKAHQFKIVSAPNGGKFFSSADMANKELYATLPAPDLGGVGPVSPYAAILSIPGGDPGLPPQDQFLFGTGAPA
jgi:phospholipase C